MNLMVGVNGQQWSLETSAESRQVGDSEMQPRRAVSETPPINRRKQSTESLCADRSAFRERLREVVSDLGSEAELERRAGLPVATITHYTRKRPSEPSRAYLVKIALAAEVSIAWLAAGIGPKRASK